MAGITRFEEIEAWKSARQLTIVIYKLSEQGVFAKDYEFTDKTSRQITRFINYLEAHSRSHRFGEDAADYNADV